MAASHEMPSNWTQDAEHPDWWFARGIGSIRHSQSYRLAKKAGWWFLPDWLPDDPFHDVGPFKTRRTALDQALVLAEARMVSS